MKRLFGIAVIVALCGAGCNKKKSGDGEAAKGGASGAVATAPSTPTSAKPKEAAPAAKGMTCDGLGGKMAGDTCQVKGHAPFTATFTGKFDTDAMHPNPGALFKVTNTLDVPVHIVTAQLYAYDKAGNQLEITAGDQKVKSAMLSMRALIKLEPKETVDFIHSVGKDSLPPEMDTLQLEFPMWTGEDDGATFELAVDDLDVRPKDGWK